MCEGNKTDNLSDETLVVRARANDTAALETLLMRYKELVNATARRFFLSTLDREDLAQEGMIGLFSAVMNYDPENGRGASFKTFASLCIRRQLIDTVKKNGGKRAETVLVPLLEGGDEPSEETPEELVIAAENRQEFTEKMSKVLSKYELRVLNLFIDGLAYDEIAVETKKTVKSVDNALQRSKKKLLELYKEKTETAL